MAENMNERIEERLTSQDYRELTDSPQKDSATRHRSLESDLGPKNDIDVITGESWEVAMREKDAYLAGLSKELAELTNSIPFDSDQFPIKVYPAYEAAKKRINDLREKRAEITNGEELYYGRLFCEFGKTGDKYIISFGTKSYGENGVLDSPVYEKVKRLILERIKLIYNVEDDTRITKIRGDQPTCLIDKTKNRRFYLFEYQHCTGEEMIEGYAVLDDFNEAIKIWEDLKQFIIIQNKLADEWWQRHDEELKNRQNNDNEPVNKDNQSQILAQRVLSAINRFTKRKSK